VVALNSTTGYDGVTLQYRRSESDTWAAVPVGDVTYQSSGTGIGSWPVHCAGWTSCTGTTGNTYPVLVWNATNTLGAEGPVQLQAVFWTGATIQPTIVTTTRNAVYDPNQFGGSYATAPIGPGSVNLLTGNYALGAGDVSQAGLAVSREFNSRDPNNATGVFGPGWTSTVAPGDLTYRSLTDNTTNVVVHAANGGLVTFRQQPGGSYASQDGVTELTLVKCTTGGTTCATNVNGRFELKLLSFETWGFQLPSGASDYVVVDVTTPSSAGAGSASWTVVSGVAQPTQEIAPPPAGVSCTSSPLTTRGCQSLTFTYGSSTTATGTAETNWGDYVNQLKTVNFTAWDPDLGTPAMRTVAVASYLYDNTGHLRAAWDPRVPTSLKFRYTYNSNGQIATVTPPGLQPFTINYAPIGSEPSTVGRLASVQRPTLDSSGTVNGTATSTVVYQIPLSVTGGGPYEMLPANTSTWAQTDNPTDATAIYPPDQTPSGTPPSSYTRATVTYMNINGQTVNTAAPGGEITTTEHGASGNEMRTLSASNRQQALASSPDTKQEAADARLLDTQSIYDINGLLTDMFGPAHMVDLPDGTARPARAHTRNLYDQGAPGGATYNLVTTTSESATPTDGTAEQDTRTTTNAYAIGTNTAGWTLGSPLQTTVDPGTGTHLNLTTTTLQDATTGQLTERRLPANPSGGDAHATVFVYYTAGTNSLDSVCGNRPEWTGLPCKQAPAAQPGTSGLPTIKISYVTKYNLYGRPEESQDKDTTGVTLRTKTVLYDASERQTTQAVSATGLGASVSTSVTSYDTQTGLATTTVTASQTITRGYDTLGRMTSYTDADGNTTTSTYDALDRPSTVNDGKATTTYTYDDVGGEARGLLTTVTDSSIGAFTATYNADGQLATQASPGGLTATYTYNEAGAATDLRYNKGTGFWPDSSVRYNVHGERTFTTSDLFIYNYSYDAAGRLTNTYEQNIFGCLNRAYTFDADTNRTALTTTSGVTWTSNPANCPPTGSGTTVPHSYDSADRVTGAGYTYDALGRTTAMPASDSPNGHTTTLGYYVNDLVNTTASNSTTLTYNLDPNRRVRTWSSSADSQTHTNHYGGDADAPAWTSENTAGTNWTRSLVAFNGFAASTNQAGTVTLELRNIHGDVIGPATTSDTTWNLSAAQSETDEYGSPKGVTGARYDYLGTQQRQRDVNSGLQLMGQRVYNPAAGRFLQTDPALGGSANAYDYVGANPVNERDLGGLCRSGNYANAYYLGMQWLGVYNNIAVDDMSFDVPLIGVLHWSVWWMGYNIPISYTDYCQGMPIHIKITNATLFPFSASFSVTASCSGNQHHFNGTILSSGHKDLYWNNNAGCSHWQVDVSATSGAATYFGVTVWTHFAEYVGWI
jgi:RHS repeat-associated protein